MFHGFDFGAIFTAAGVAKLVQIIIGDLTMAGDNVVIMGSLAAGLPPKDRRKVLLFGVSMALVCLIIFAVIATQLLRVTGLVFAGGLLLLWVAYNMWTELRPQRTSVTVDDPDTAAVEGPPASKSFLQAAIGIAIADLSMSLDNVLLVASIARENPALLFIGLSFSVLFMGLAANYVARLIERYSWLNYIGLAVIVWVAGNMIYEGWAGGEHVMGLRQVLRLGQSESMDGGLITASALAAFFEILFIDIVLAGDNAIVVGALAAGLPADQRKKVIMIGVLAALVLRIGFALLVTQLLQIVGLVLAGGILLLWVAWRMYRELRHKGESEGSEEIAGDEHSGLTSARSFASAAWGVALADVSMSLDNVLAVAGAAREHPYVLVFGLILSVLLMGLAANIIAKYIDRYRWIAWGGLIVILWVACKMIYEGAGHVAPHIAPLFT